jgi:hypothetical protein
VSKLQHASSLGKNGGKHAEKALRTSIDVQHIVTMQVEFPSNVGTSSFVTANSDTFGHGRKTIIYDIVDLHLPN